jgi:chaperonin GroES
MATVKLQPLGSRILVAPEEEQQTTASGIVIAPTANKEKSQRGKVIKLGSGGHDKDGKKIEFTVKEGDTIFFKKYSPDEFEVDGETYLIMDEADVLAVLK